MTLRALPSYRRIGLPLLAALAAACAGEAASESASAPSGSGDVPSPAAPRGVDAPDTVQVEIANSEAIEAFFEEVGYDSTHWQAGVREVPRMYVTEVPPRWGERARSDLSVQAKKRIFFRAMAPLALRANELVRAERETLLALPAGDALSAEERAWLAELAEDYGLKVPGAGEDEGVGDGGARGGAAAEWDALKEALALRVDEVPVSLVLAQAANESGWGTSRFASQGNALFGQWSFGGSGMLPEEQRASLGDYRVASFESPLMSVVAYMRNLNTHAAYARLRELRAAARAAGEMLRGHELAAGLDRYSERGQDYVDELRSMIDYNGLAATDETYLADDPVYLILPVVADEEG